MPPFAVVNSAKGADVRLERTCARNAHPLGNKLGAGEPPTPLSVTRCRNG